MDLGGLSLLDLDDPEIGPLESPTRDPSFEVDLGESDSASGSDSVDSSTISSKFVLSDPFVYTAALGDAQSTDIPDSPPPAVSETASPVPCTPVKEASGDDDDTSFASDMTSPVGRGPVILPVFSIRSPVAHTTPVRGLEPSAFFDDLPLPQFGTDEAFSLPSLESPNSRGTTTPRYPALLPLATPASARIGSLTPARSVGKLKPIDLGDRPVKVLKSVHAGGALHSRSENDRRVEKAKERANRINGQLDAIYASKLAPTARPTAATMSTKIPERVSESVQKPRVRVGDSSSAPSRSTALSPKKIMRPSAPASVLKSALKPTSTLPTPRPASAQPNKRLAPTTVKAKPNGLPRPVARRPMAPPSVVAGPSFAQPTKSTSLHAGRPVVATPTTTGVKRPFSATQPVSAHPAAAAAAGRLGLPSRMTHSSAPSASPFAFGGASTLSVGGPLSHPPVRSPSRTLGSSLGKPSRGTGTTPTPQRTLKVSVHLLRGGTADLQLGTPSRPMATPLKSGPMRPMAYSSYTAQPKVTLVPETTEPGPAPVDGGDSASGSAPTERSGDSPSSSSSNSGGDAGNGGDRTPPAGNGSDGGSAGNNNNAGHTPPERPPPSSSPPDESPPADDVANEAEKMDVDEAKPAAEPAAKEPSPSTPPPGDDVSSPVPTEIDVDPPEDSTPPAPPSSAEEPPQPAAESSSLRRTSKRSVRPPTKLVPTPAAPRAKAQPVESIVPGMSEKELKTATHRNTMRNEVYYCAIDRIIVRKTGARPPSPEPKIRMTADREEEDRKRQRDQRARRRQRGSGGDEPMSEDEEAVPLIEQVEQHRAPGDEADYQTPARPLKRARIESSDDEADDERPSVPERYVRWNRALTVIRGGLGEHRPVPAAASASPSATPQPSGSASASGSGSSSTSTSAAEQQLRSCLRPSSMVPLDKHGNVLERPIERLKRAKVPVTAVFYDGEEPLPVPAYNPNYNPRSKSKK